MNHELQRGIALFNQQRFFDAHEALEDAWRASEGEMRLLLQGLTQAAVALHLAELREGVWIRPDNLDPQRFPTFRAVLDHQCIHFHGAATDITPDKVRSIFSLGEWADDARALIEAMDVALKTGKRDDSTETITREFALSIAVVRHLQLDPLLPVELIGEHWAGHTLRSTYRRFDHAFKQRMDSAFRRA